MTQVRKRQRAASKAPELSSLLEPQLFKALADPTRLALLGELARRGCACTVSEASACCPVDLSVVSRHLATLRQAGVVEAEKRGREVYYTVRARDLAGLLRGLADALECCCPTDEGNGKEKGR